MTFASSRAAWSDQLCEDASSKMQPSARAADFKCADLVSIDFALCFLIVVILSYTTVQFESSEKLQRVPQRAAS